MREWGELPERVRREAIVELGVIAERHVAAADHCHPNATIARTEHLELAEALRAAIRVLEREGRK